jgi:NhaA family Na+:H+ antiporter
MTRAIRAVRFAADRYLALPAGALIALAWANSRPESYFAWAHALSFPVNDVAMVFFFALVTGEIIEATAPGGALHTWRRAVLPVVGAVGGIAGSALAYVGYLRMGDESSVLIGGWPIPCAADLAFGYFIVRNICRRHPAIPFFLLLGIASDILGLVIVELRYPTSDHQPAGALLIAGAIAAAMGLRHCRVIKVWPYILIGGALSWWGIFLSGLHPALALVPVMPFLPHRRHHRRRLADVRADADDSLGRFARSWRYPVQLILLCFALVNAGAVIRGFGTGTWAVAIAALAGKPAGVLAAVAVAVALGLHLPHRVGWRELTVVACATSIGFTFALFFATAAIPVGPILVEAKLGALLTVCGSLIATAAAFVLGVGRFAKGRGAGSVRGAGLDTAFGSTVDIA